MPPVSRDLRSGSDGLDGDDANWCSGARLHWLIAVVDDHEHALGVGAGLDANELLDQRVEWDDPVLVGAAVKQLGATRVPGSEVTQSAASGRTRARRAVRA